MWHQFYKQDKIFQFIFRLNILQPNLSPTRFLLMMIVQYNSCTLFSYSYINYFPYIDYYVLLWMLSNNTLYLLYCHWLVRVYLVYYISCTIICVYHFTLTQLHTFFYTYKIVYMCISSTNVFKFYMLHTRHIAYWLLFNVPHELRIKCYSPPSTQTASAPYLVIQNWISFNQRLSKADIIFPTLSTENLLGYFTVSLRGIFRHWVGTVMPYWLWLTFEMDRTAIEQSLH